jgi:hypothetical protein
LPAAGDRKVAADRNRLVVVRNRKG